MAGVAGMKRSQVVTDKTEKSGVDEERLFVTKDTPIADVVSWEQEGKPIFFTEDIDPLPEDVVKEFSKLTSIKYHQALEIKERMARQDPEFAGLSQRLEISQRAYASPRDIAFGNKAKPGLTAKLVREDNVGYRESQGYVLARPEHMVAPKMRQVEGHYEHGTIGAPKEYLMVIADEDRKAIQKRNRELHHQIDERQVEDIKQKTRDAGLPAFDVG